MQSFRDSEKVPSSVQIDKSTWDRKDQNGQRQSCKTLMEQNKYEE